MNKIIAFFAVSFALTASAQIPSLSQIAQNLNIPTSTSAVCIKASSTVLPLITAENIKKAVMAVSNGKDVITICKEQSGLDTFTAALVCAGIDAKLQAFLATELPALLKTKMDAACGSL